MTIRCIIEAANADRLVLYCEAGEVLKGALIEMGAALARGIEVVCVGEGINWPSGSAFARHPRIRFAQSIQEAIA